MSLVRSSSSRCVINMMVPVCRQPLGWHGYEVHNRVWTLQARSRRAALILSKARAWQWGQYSRHLVRTGRCGRSQLLGTLVPLAFTVDGFLALEQAENTEAITISSSDIFGRSDRKVGVWPLGRPCESKKHRYSSQCLQHRSVAQAAKNSRCNRG